MSCWQVEALLKFCVPAAEAVNMNMSQGKKIGHPQTCVYPDVSLGIAHVSGKVPLSGQGPVDTQCICPFRPTDSLGRKGQIHCVSARPLVRGEGLYQIHGQSLNTHRGKHRSGGAQEKHININTFPGLLGGLQILLTCSFWGSFLMEEKKHMNKIPPEIPETIPRKMCLICIFFWLFSLPNIRSRKN